MLPIIHLASMDTWTPLTSGDGYVCIRWQQVCYTWHDKIWNSGWCDKHVGWQYICCLCQMARTANDSVATSSLYANDCKHANWMYDYTVLRLCPSSGVQTQHVSKTVSVSEMWRGSYSVMSNCKNYYLHLFSAMWISNNSSLLQLRIAVYIGCNTTCLCHPLTWEQKQIQLLKHCVVSALDNGQRPYTT